MKIETTLEDDVRARRTKNGVLIDLAFFLPADVIREAFVADEDHSIDDILSENTVGKRVHWKLSGDRWNALVKADLAPTWYGKFVCDVHDIKASDFKDKNGEARTSLVGVFRPISSSEGVKIGTTDTLEVIETRKEDDADAE